MPGRVQLGKASMLLPPRLVQSGLPPTQKGGLVAVRAVAAQAATVSDGHLRRAVLVAAKAANRANAVRMVAAARAAVEATAEVAFVFVRVVTQRGLTDPCRVRGSQASNLVLQEEATDLACLLSQGPRRSRSPLRHVSLERRLVERRTETICAHHQVDSIPSHLDQD